jgi:hypothetical protein
MSILDRAKAHFESQGVTKIEVPEWPDENGNPTILYSSPLTMNDRRALRAQSGDDEQEFVIRLVIRKCELEDGVKAFDLSDKPMLMEKVDPNVLHRIANKIAEVHTVDEMVGK